MPSICHWQIPGGLAGCTFKLPWSPRTDHLKSCLMLYNSRLAPARGANTPKQNHTLEHVDKTFAKRAFDFLLFPRLLPAPTLGPQLQPWNALAQASSSSNPLAWSWDRNWLTVPWKGEEWISKNCCKCKSVPLQEEWLTSLSIMKEDGICYVHVGLAVPELDSAQAATVPVHPKT